MQQLKTFPWWANFWANVSSPSSAEIFSKGVFETCHKNNLGLTVAFTINGGSSLAEILPYQPGVDFDKLRDQLLPHQGKAMSFINDLHVII